MTWFGDGWKNEEIDRLYDEALATADDRSGCATYQRIQEIIAEEVPNLYTVQPYKFQVVRHRVRACTSRSPTSTPACGRRA